MLYHITTANYWQEFEEKGFYEAPTQEQEGFIHLSTDSQVAGVLERYYQGQTNLVLLHVNDEKLTAELKYEKATNDELFPHLYGSLNKSAIEKVEVLC